MAVMRVNPNRMELLRLKGKLRVARRGHKLLKDKRDEMMRQFLSIVLDVDTMRRDMELLLENGHRKMLQARGAVGGEIVDEALMGTGSPVMVSVTEENTMSVRTPVFRVAYREKDEDDVVDEMGCACDDSLELEGRERDIEREKQYPALPYGMTTAPGQLDDVLDTFSEALPLMMKLATLEHKSHLLAAEIERTRRRVNSLEYVMIPSLEETIYSITMKMDEDERGNLTRLMKVKDMIVEQEVMKRRRKTAEVLDEFEEKE